MLALLLLLPQWAACGRRFAGVVLVLLFCAGGASASALHIGTVASDVQSASFGSSQITRAVGAAADGTIYVGFFSADRTQLRVAHSIDRGATFSPSVYVDTAAAGKTFATASLAVSSAGSVLVAYADSAASVFFARSIDAGVTFTPVPTLGTAGNTGSGVQVQSQGNYVYVGYTVFGGGVAVATSSDGGATFPAPPVTVVITGGYFGLLVDQSNGDVIVGGENANLYVRVSHDHGANFDPVQNPSGQAFFSNWTLSSDISGRYIWVGGTAIANTVYQIDTSSWVSTARSAFLSTGAAQARSMYAVGCGDIVDSIDGSWAVLHDFGTTLGTTHSIAGTNQTTLTNPLNGDVLVTYQNGTDTQLDVYQDEAFGCGAHLSLTVSDGHDFARYGKTMNYLVTLSSAGYGSADGIAVSLSTPGTGLDLANAQWQCVASDNTALCASSSGNGPSLGTVTLPAGTHMNWVVSVPVLATTTDDTIELDANAVGSLSASGSDTDALVVFRNGFDVTNSDGTRIHQ
jgi:hypothetical protein